jgi:putative nucleotidyltransferase with HDIG domain
VTRRQGLILGVQLAVLGTAAIGAALTSRTADWHPAELVGLILVLAVFSDSMSVEVHRIRISGSFLALVLAMVLLGPAPAAAIGAASMVVDAVARKLPWNKTMNNLATFTTFPLVGGLLMDRLAPETALGQAPALLVAAAVLAVFLATNFMNFAMVAIFHRASFGIPFWHSFTTVFLKVLPSELPTGLLTAAIAFSYAKLGVGAVALLALVLFVFQYLIRAVVMSEERGKELEQRTRELASLQVGLLSTVMQTLSMRDAMTARHSAAVARYSREVAGLLGLGEREQELIHTAALLHDIGKFIFPDSILFADRRLTDDEWQTVQLHPEQGARLVRRIEGYGPVADIIISHHERVDGGGYPNGLEGDHIPLGSRIIAVADTYDVMTARDSYRRPVSREAAIAELRRVSGSQLDTKVVETFIEMIESGRVAFHHADESDFEQELAFDRRVLDYARPRVAVA